MKLRLAIAALAIVTVSTHAAETKIALVGGTVINPADGKVVEDALVVIDGDSIESVGSRRDSSVPAGARVLDCKGKFILPGYIDTHVHFFQSGGLFTRPDVVDLNAVRPYAEELAAIKADPEFADLALVRMSRLSVMPVSDAHWARLCKLGGWTRK